MRYICRYLILIVVMSGMIVLTGCKKTEEQSNTIVGKSSIDSNTEKANATNQPFFPSTYRGGTEKIKFDCRLEIGNEFEPLNFCVPKVNGLEYIDGKKAYADFVEGKDIEEHYTNPTEDKMVPEENIYIHADGSLTEIGTGFIYGNPNSPDYLKVMKDNEINAPQEEFSFETSKGSIDKIKKKLSEMAYPVDEFLFSWFSMSGEEYENLEQEYLDNERLEVEQARGNWTDADDTYIVYAWQMYEGLPVFPQLMTTRGGRALESYQKAPVSGICSEQGIISLYAETAYSLETSGEPVDFMSFPEIAATVEKKYENLLDDAVYNVERAKLAIRIYFDESQNYAAEPIWYFEVADNMGGKNVVLVNALTGIEIFLTP